MKKLLLAVCALAAISLLAPSAGFAQEFLNRIGIYTTADCAAAEILTPTAFVPTTIHFVLSSPRFDDGSPMTSIDAFEFKVTITGTAGLLFRLAETLPANSINVGDSSNPYDAEYVVGCAAALPVVSDRVALMSWNVLLQSVANPFYFFVAPTSAPALPGSLAINNTTAGTATLVACTASSGAYTDAVFAMGDGTIPTESETFGGVKALFR